MSDENDNLYVLRVTQLDTSELDDMLLINLRQTLNQDYLKYIQTQFIQKYNVELFALIKLILWYNTYFKNGQTIGQSILDWSYKDKNLWVKKLLHACFYCLNEWMEERLPDLIKDLTKYFLIRNNSQLSDDDQSNERLRERIILVDKYLNYLKSAFKLTSFINYLLFLYNGKYFHLWERLLKLRPVYNTQQFMREYDNKLSEREELWQSYFALYKMTNTLIDFKKTFKKLSQNFLANKNKSIKSNEGIDIETCGICFNEPTNVHCSVDFNNLQGTCNHVFCYICIRKHLHDNNQNYYCTICEKNVNSIEIYLKNSNYF